jgi:hypothetical protein
MNSGQSSTEVENVDDDYFDEEFNREKGVDEYLAGLKASVMKPPDMVPLDDKRKPQDKNSDQEV